MQNSALGRRTYLDALRVLASFLVCYNHAHGYHLFLDQEPNGSLISWFNVFMSVFTTINIPLFFMLSGSLLLGKEESYKTLFEKRISRFIVLLVSISAITYMVIPPEEISLVNFIYSLFRGNINGSFWYLYAYLSFLLILPLLRKFADRITHQDIILLIVLRTIFIPGVMVLNYWLKYWGFEAIVLSESLRLPMATFEFLFYPIIGYFLSNKLNIHKISPKQIVMCMVILLGGSMISALMTYAEGIHFGFTQTYLGLFNYTSAISVFIIVRYFMEKISIPNKLAVGLSKISSVTIGIYLLEPIVCHYFYTAFFSLVPWHPIIITVFSVIWCILCMSIGGSVTYLLRKIPGVKKYL